MHFLWSSESSKVCDIRAGHESLSAGENYSSFAIANVTTAKSCASSRPEGQPSVKARFIKVAGMKAEYDLSKLKSRKNPCASRLKNPVTMRLSEDVVDYFKGMAQEAGIPYQSLIDPYLRDCLAQHRKLQIKWPQAV